jgi:hypothetical protein
LSFTWLIGINSPPFRHLKFCENDDTSRQNSNPKRRDDGVRDSVTGAAALYCSINDSGTPLNSRATTDVTNAQHSTTTTERMKIRNHQEVPKAWSYHRMSSPSPLASALQFATAAGSATPTQSPTLIKPKDALGFFYLLIAFVGVLVIFWLYDRRQAAREARGVHERLLDD